MSEELYKKAKRVFLEVCDLPHDRQESRLEELCAGDDALRAEVSSLLAHYDADATSTGFVSGVSDLRRAAPAPEEPPMRERVGAYRILHELGRGGMGVVYLGQIEEGPIQRRAAVKVLKRGMDTEDILRRFNQERQLLASLNHPNIARLYDAGETEDGLPYFAMEYIEGLPIDAYCDAQRLNIEGRLKLFRSVCSAVHHAHQNLIVHRDLKPSNILVDRDGLPKLLDFGIAKLVNPEMTFIHADQTAPELRVMTPEYASPEQVRGNLITTLSDIYSLGVLLYELVSGHRPYRLRSRIRDEIVRVVCEEEPERPSTAISRVEEVTLSTTTGPQTSSITPESVGRTRELRPERLRRRLSGDIDNIVLMAMRKEPQRRYMSAEQLADDIRRHLEGQIVIARKDTLTYRALVFLRRHRVAAAAAIVVVASLAVGLSVAAAGWSTAESERTAAVEAQTQAEQARALADRRLIQVLDFADVPVFDVYADIKHIDGTLPARQTILDGALHLLEQISADLENETPEVARFRADLIEQIGVSLAGFEGVTAGDAPEALDHLEQALQMRRAFLAESPGATELRLRLARTLSRRATLLRVGNRPADAQASAAEALEILRDLGDEDLRLLGTALYEAGTAAYLLDEPYVPLYEECLTVRRRAAAAAPDDLLRQRDLAVILNRLGAARRRADETAEARALYEESLEIRRARLEKVTNAQSLNDFASCLILVSDLERQLGEFDDAIEHATRGRSVLEDRVCLNTDSPRYADSLSKVLYVLGVAHAGKGEIGRAAAHLDESLRYAMTAVGRDGTSAIFRRSAATAHRALADVAIETGDRAGAAEQLAAGYAVLAPLLASERPDARVVRDAIVTLTDLAVQRIELGQLAGGLTALRDAQGLYDDRLRPQSRRRHVEAIVAGQRRLAVLMVALDDRSGARGTLDQALQLLQPFDDDDIRALRVVVEAELAALDG